MRGVVFLDNQLVIVLDFGGQYNQLIARRVRECNVYCEVMPYTKSLEELKAKNPSAIIFTGGPNSVYEDGSPLYTKEIFSLGVAVSLSRIFLTARLPLHRTIPRANTAKQKRILIRRASFLRIFPMRA